jgi:hypothetical protein
MEKGCASQVVLMDTAAGQVDRISRIDIRLGDMVRPLVYSAEMRTTISFNAEVNLVMILERLTFVCWTRV